MIYLRIRLIGLILLIIPFLLGSVPSSPAACSSNYTYYVFVSWETSSAFVFIVAVRDNTTVQIYTLPGLVLISEAELNAMGKHFVSLPIGGAYKIVSNNAVYVILFSGMQMPSPETNEGPIPFGFHTSTEGTYVGKEFVLLASQGLVGKPYRILALEKSQINVYKEDGEAYASFRLEANEYYDISFSAFKIYKITSTGNIMIQSIRPWRDRSFFIPAVEGGFMGKSFFSKAREWAASADFGFKILALDDTKVTIWDVESKRKIQELNIKSGDGAVIIPKGDELKVEADKPITLSYIHNWTKIPDKGLVYGSGVAYMGVKANEETVFFLPLEGTAEAYIFAYEDAFVEIDDVPMTLEADHYYRIIHPGTHRIVSDKKVVIQMMHRSITIPRSAKSFAVVIPCIQTLDVESNVRLIPLTGGDYSLTYIMIGVVCTFIVAAGTAFVIVKRKRAG